MKTTTIQTTLNFGGFYNSIHSDKIDNYIESLGMDFETVDYYKTPEEYSKGLIIAINQKLDTNINFISLNSPTYYNYVTDVIKVNINKKDILKLFKYIKQEELKEGIYNNIKESTTMRDGYIPFYKYEDFFKKDNLDLLIEIMLEEIYKIIEDDIIENIEFDIIENN